MQMQILKDKAKNIIDCLSNTLEIKYKKEKSKKRESIKKYKLYSLVITT